VSLQKWARNGWLTAHQSSQQEIGDLFAVVDRDLNDCQSKDLSEDWQLAIAYNAALQLAVASLAASGYRASRDAQHYRAIQSLAFTLGLDSKTVAKLDAFRKKRNVSDYERVGLVSEKEAAEMVALARKLRADVFAWLMKHHPEFLPRK
jgi:hypothetical protein